MLLQVKTRRRKNDRTVVGKARLILDNGNVRTISRDESEII